MPSMKLVVGSGLLVFVMAASACRGDRAPNGSGSSDLEARAAGRTEFSSVLPAGTGSPPKGGPPPSPTLGNETPSSVAFGETTAVVGSTLFTLSAYRGLQVVQTEGQPRIVGRVPIPGEPHSLFVAGTTAFAVMSRTTKMVSCASCPGQVRPVDGALLAAVDVSDPAQPRLLGSLPIEGLVLHSHVQGSKLFLVLRQGDWAWAEVPAGQPSTTLVAIDIGAPAALRLAGRFDVTAPAWVDEVRFAPGVAYLAVYGRQFWDGGGCQALGTMEAPDADGCTRLQAVDLSTLTVGASLELPGRLFPGASDHHQGILRALVVSSGARRPSSSRFITLAAATAAQLAPLGSLDVSALISEQAKPRFEGTRAYVPANDQNNPLLIIDFQQPSNPTLGGRLPAVGQVQNMVTSVGGRLVTMGVERLSPPCAKGELAIFDVGDSTAPSLLARQTFAARGGGMPFGLMEAGDLLLLPFYSPRTADLPRASIPPIGVQLVEVDVAGGRLTPRGQALVGGAMQRFARAGDRVLSIGYRRTVVLDVRDRETPSVVSTVELSRSVSDVKLAAGSSVQVVDDHEQRTFQLQVTPATDPEASVPTAVMTFQGRAGQLFTQEGLVYLFWEAHLPGGEEPRLQVLEVQAGKLLSRGSVSLAGPAEVDLRHEPDRAGFAQQVRQVSATTFLVPLRRVRDCGQRTIPTSPAPTPAGCGDSTGVAPTPAPPPPPPPSPVGACPGSDADFLVIDASKPDAPGMTSRFRLEGDDEILGAIGRDRTVFLTQRERTIRADRTQLVRYLVTEVLLDDPSRPTVRGRVNVPGPMVAERTADRTWFTVEPVYADRGPATGVVVNALYRDVQSDRVFLQRQLELRGAVSGPEGDGDTLFFTVDGQLVAVDLRGPEAPRILSRTPVADASSSGDGGSTSTGYPVHPVTDPPTPYALPANVHAVVGGHVFVMLRHAILLAYDARDPAHPRLLDRFVVSSGPSPVRAVAGNQALIARGELGVELVELAP
jgi:hypothetical protein